MTLSAKSKSSPSHPNRPAPRRLRQHLKEKVRHWSVSRIADDINDSIAAEANRATAKAIAARMAGDASADVAASIARTPTASFSSEVNRVRDVTGVMLEAFLG